MDKQKITKLKTIIKNNFSTPLIIEGAHFKEGENVVVLSSKTNSKDLAVVALEHGYKYPNWLIKLNEKAKSKSRLFLVIDGIDDITPDEQLKFYEILKNRATSCVKLPNNVQILLTSHSKELNPVISSLTILYKLEKN